MTKNYPIRPKSLCALLSIIGILLFSLSLSAQEHYGYVNGIIVDSLTNKHLIGVTVYVPDETVEYGAVTDVNGFYSLKLPAGIHELKISYIGYEDKDITVNISEEETLTQNILIHLPILRKPETGPEIASIYGHWEICQIHHKGIKKKASRADKKRKSAGLHYRPFSTDSDGIGIFSYSDGCNGVGDFYFRHSGDGQIEKTYTTLSSTLKGCQPVSRFYNNLHFGRLYDSYTVEFPNKKTMIIQNEDIWMECERVE